MENKNEKFEKALYYSSLGWHIFPCHSVKDGKCSCAKKESCTQPGKHPRTSHGLLDATKDKVTIKNWWQKWPDANIGCTTGSVSGIIVIDLDIKHGKSVKEMMSEMHGKAMNLPLTVSSKTGKNKLNEERGLHLFYANNGQPVKSQTNILGHLGIKGVDIRADGGYVILPPSDHYSGAIYEWDIEPEGSDKVENLEDLPAWILLQEKDLVIEKTDWEKFITTPILEGERNNAAAKYAGKLLYELSPEFWEIAGWTGMKEWNKIHVNPSLSEKELRSIWESIKNIHMASMGNQTSKLELENEYTPLELNLRKKFLENKEKGVYAIAEYLAQTYHVKTIGKKDQSREMYFYQNGLYKPSFGFIQKEVQRIIKDLSGNSKKKEVIETVKDITWIERSKFNPPKNLLNFKNGIYDIENKDLFPHTSDLLFLNQIPVIFDPKAHCPKIKSFFNQILDYESIEVIQEWIGYTLYRSYFLKKAIIFVGERDTGKTTLLRIIDKLLGQENISGVSLQKISIDRFSLSNLYNKHVNIYDDLSSKDINDSGTFKMLTGGGTVTGEIKFGDQFQFENYAKLTFSCNKIPIVRDLDDEAYFSRWILIQFKNRSKTPDKFLIQKITTQKEMSGLVNFVLKGLHRLLKNQDFSYQQTPEEIKIEMSLSASYVAQFVHTQLEAEADPRFFITKDEMHQAFIDYAKTNDFQAIPKETLGKGLQKFIKVSSGYKSIRNQETGRPKQVACWLGVRFKNPDTLLSVTPEEPDLFNK